MRVCTKIVILRFFEVICLRRRGDIRIDIQALRGWAVAIVVLNHAGFGWMPSGFLGVDVFFVISGFLITGVIARSVAEGHFSFKEFYFRRARRILPAAFVTIALTAVGSIWFLTSLEIASLGDQTLGALTYTINFVLWKQVDYFAADANMKPLLHMWSLAVEEQFYIILPLLLFAAPARWWKGIVVGLTLASFVFCMWWVQFSPAGAFYMLPSRAWELGIGAMAALFVRNMHGRTGTMLSALYWPSLLVLLGLPFTPYDYAHPGWVAGAICISTAVLILANNQSVARTWIVRAMARLGDISYSLYLVHWPVMVFAYSAYIGEVPQYLPLVTISLSLVFAWAMYEFVEQPSIRYFKQPNMRFSAAVSLVTVCVAAVYYGSAAYANSAVDFEALRAPNYGLNKRCDYAGQLFEERNECVNSHSPNVLVWGDSFAMHLVPGLSGSYSLVQATFSSCAPFPGYVKKRRKYKVGHLWYQRCLDFNAGVSEYVDRAQHIDTVVLSSPWRFWVSPGNVALFRDADGDLVERETGIELAIDAISPVLKSLRDNDKQVVIFGPPPAADLDTGACLERVATGKVLLSGSCQISRDAALQKDVAVNAFLDRLEDEFNVQVVRLSDLLCENDHCMTQIDGVPVYRDQGHLSIEGSRLLLENRAVF